VIVIVATKEDCHMIGLAKGQAVLAYNCEILVLAVATCLALELALSQAKGQAVLAYNCEILVLAVVTCLALELALRQAVLANFCYIVVQMTAIYTQRVV
jgi:hypothetical protein